MTRPLYAPGDLIEAEIPGGVRVVGRIVPPVDNLTIADGYIVESVSPADDGHCYIVREDGITVVLDSSDHPA